MKVYKYKWAGRDEGYPDEWETIDMSDDYNFIYWLEDEYAGEEILLDTSDGHGVCGYCEIVSAAIGEFDTIKSRKDYDFLDYEGCCYFGKNHPQGDDFDYFQNADREYIITAAESGKEVGRYKVVKCVRVDDDASQDEIIEALSR